MAVPNTADQAARRELAEACHHVYTCGLVPGAGGNMSLRCGNRMLVTPTGRSLGAIVPEELVLLEMDGTVVGPGKPSMEWGIHLGTMVARPEVNAVVHVHPPYAASISCWPGLDPEMALPIYTPGYAVFVGLLPLVPFLMPGSQELADTCVKALKGHPAIMMANHGIATTADSLERAINIAEELEANARMHIILQGQGKALSPALFNLVKEQYHANDPNH